jgi:hypothetical protein
VETQNRGEQGGVRLLICLLDEEIQKGIELRVQRDAARPAAAWERRKERDEK